MSVVVLCSAHGAPGTTTTAWALARVWPEVHPGRRVLLIDADPAGSGLLTGPLLGGVPDEAGVSMLAATHAPLTIEQLMRCCVALNDAGAQLVLPGITDPVQARPLASTWAALCDLSRDLSDSGIDVLVDLGRVGHRHEPTVWTREADVVCAVVRGDVASVAPTAATVRALIEQRGSLRAPIAVAVELGGYSPRDVGQALGVAEVLALPIDRWTAQTLGSSAVGGWRLDRSPLLRAARAVATRLGELAPARTGVTS